MMIMTETDVKALRRSLLLLAAGLLSTAVLGACTPGTEPASSEPEEAVPSAIQIEDPAHAEPFTHEEIPVIQGNLMHEKHFESGAICGECHLSTEPMPITRAHEICSECHEANLMAKPVWDNHCLSCHFFSQGAQNAAGNPVLLGEALCHECHSMEEPGWMLFAACPFKAPEGQPDHIVCSRCHQPHQSAAPVSQEHCEECHAEFKETKHLAGQEADCTMCHRPHRAQPTGDILCVTCHGKAENVMVHTIEQHPEDCLECHNAHFAQISIKGVCVDCHEGMVYNGSSYQPAAHLDCRNCHHLDDFQVYGNRPCIECHSENAAALEYENMPPEHANCRNCHPPHTWRVPTSRRCEKCHEPRKFFEHQVSFHPDECLACHDPHRHNEIPASGDCLACHTDGSVPEFGPRAPDAHKICGNCHSPAQMDGGEYGYMAAQDSCMLCHADARVEPLLSWSDVPEGHRFCSGCHAAHDWGLRSTGESCWLCHAEAATAPDEMHAACYNCHAAEHGFAFVGEAESCHLCHTVLSEDLDPETSAECLACHVLH